MQIEKKRDTQIYRRKENRMMMKIKKLRKKETERNKEEMK